MSARYDAIVVGGGHNGLVAAAYLARAGLSVAVLERRPIVGGACVTEEIAPGFRVSTTSYVCSLLRPEILRELRLAAHGFKLIPYSTSFIPFPDGRHLLLGLGAEQDAERIARFSRKDADAYPRFNAALRRLADCVRPTLALTPPDLGALGLRGLLDLLKMGQRFRSLRRSDQSLLLKLLTMSVADLLEEWFESPQLRAALSASGTIGLFGSPRTPGTALVLLHYQLGDIAGEASTWGFVRGGMGALAEAIAAAARSHGAVVRTGADVERILVEDGAARGVALDSGEEIEAKVVASNADPKRTFLRLVGPSHLPEEFRRGIEAYRCRGNSAKVNLALSELPSFAALRGDGAHLRGSIEITGDHPDYLERAFDDCRAGRPSERPYLDITIPSTVDDTLCPRGAHVMTVSMKFVPYAPAEGDWRARREELGDLVVDTLADYAPNLRRAVIHRQVLTPADFEEIYGLTGGNISHGEMAADQLFAQRPLYGWARYRTPVRGLYLCGAGAHPGGGVMGAAGRNAAREILRDLRRSAALG
jgi:phytoene dehydrogenase-like protein